MKGKGCNMREKEIQYCGREKEMQYYETEKEVPHDGRDKEKEIPYKRERERERCSMMGETMYNMTREMQYDVREEIGGKEER